jgi:hypothetical protein
MLVFLLNLIDLKLLTPRKRDFFFKKRALSVTYAERVSQESGEGGIQRGLLFPR